MILFFVSFSPSSSNFFDTQLRNIQSTQDNQSNRFHQFSAPIDLQRVKQLFALPERITASNFLRREIAARMFERLTLINITPQRVLDAGCGEGADLPLLQQHFSAAQVVGIDGSFPMLLATHRPSILSSIRRSVMSCLPSKFQYRPFTLLSGDFAALPLGVDTCDVIWSNLALHWHPQPDKVFAEWRRVLRTNGLLMFSCFGPDTFQELRAAFNMVDQAPHVLPFVDMHDFGDMLVNIGFSTPVMDMEKITVTYATVEKLMADVRAFGGNPLHTRRRGLLGKKSWSKFVDALSQQRGLDGTISLTFEIIYGHAFLPAPTRTANGEAIVRLDWPKSRGKV